MTDDKSIRYRTQEAKSYSTLATAHTTYEVGYNCAAGLIDGQSVSVAVDFGAGAGRSSELLVKLGVQTVYAVDRSKEMVDQGRARNIRGVVYSLTDRGHIAVADGIADLAISFSVFIELTTRAELSDASAELFRVLKKGGQLIVVTTNPEAFGHNFKTFRYDHPKHSASGERVKCSIQTTNGDLELLDTYWTLQDYYEALSASGFRVSQMMFPVGTREQFPESDEPNVAPAVVIQAFKNAA